MMKDKTVKVTLKQTPAPLHGLNQFMIVKLVNAITVDTRKRTNLGVSDTLTDKEATELLPFYTVTVIK